MSQLLIAFVETMDSPTVEHNFGQTLDRYCRGHYRELARKFLIMTYNLRGNHWVSVVAVNPFAHLSRILKDNKHKSSVSGCIYFDPLKKDQGDHHSVLTMPMIFLLNSLSLYRDLAIKNTLHKWNVPTRAK